MASPMPSAPRGGWHGNSQQETTVSHDHEEPGIQTRNMGLKVHYTFDKEGKVNCLARYPHPIAVQTIPLDEATTIGVIDLRTCIQAITDCSPELAGQDGDYTIYALDYSEPDTPLVGQGMLSWAIESIEQNTSTEEPKLVTGRVTKNILGVFGRGNRETLEVRLRLTAAAKIHRPEVQRIEVPQAHHVPQPAEMAMTPTGVAEWNSFIASNPQIGQRPPNSRVASPAPSRGPQPSAPQRESSNLSQQATGSQEASRMTPTLVEFQVQMAPTASSRPSSRTSNKPSRRKPPTGRPRGRPRKKPVEGNTSGYEDGTEGEEGPAKKRAKTTQVDKASINTFGTGHDSLRVAASTSGSIRTFRPVAINAEAKTGSHLQEVPRAPTPVPDGSASGPLGRPLAQQKLRRQSTMSQDQIPLLPAPYPDPLPALSPSQEDGRSPESLAPTPAYSEDSPGDIGSSPPVPRTIPFPRSSLPPSSPILPPMPPPQIPQDSSYSTADMNDLFGGEPLAPLEEAVPAYDTSRKPTEATNSSRAPFQVFQMQDGPNGQDMVQIKGYKMSRQAPAPSRKVDTPALPPLTLDSVAGGSHPRCEKRPRPRSSRAQGPTPPPTTDAVEKSISPMPTVEPAQLPNSLTNSSKEASVGPTNEVEEMSTRPFHDAILAQADDCSFVPLPDDESMNEQSFPEDMTTQKPQQEESSVPMQEAEPSEPQHFRSERARSHQPLEPLVASLPDIEPSSKQLLPDTTTSKASQPKPSNGKPRQPRQLSRSQSAGPLALPSIPASEPAGPSSLSQCTSAETERPKTAATAIRRSASTGPLCLPIPASDPVGPTPPMVVDTSLPEPRLPPAPSSPPMGRMNNKNIVKKYAIKQRLEEAINNGEMPPFCSNCGSIETPTWRKIWVKEVEGAPEEVEFSEKPGKITAVEILRRDDENKPTLHRVIKKSLCSGDDRSTWQELVLCNPCGIWLSKNNAHRPQDRWEKDASRRGQERRRRGGVMGNSRSKKARTKNDLPSTLTSEAYLPTDALGPVEPSSPGLAGTAPAPDRSFDEGGHQLQVQYLASIDEAMVAAEQPRSNPGSTHSRGDGTAKSPIDIELDEKLGSTRRVLFPSPKKDDTPRALGELHINIMQTECRSHKELTGDKENALMVDIDATICGQDDLEALFRSPAVARPSTPPPKDKSPSNLFKTPTRSTPSHRPVTRSVSRSIRASASRSLASPVRQALFQRTPTRTPRSVRRSPRNNQISFDNVFDSPLSRTINQMLSEPNGFGLGDHELDLSSLPALEGLDGRDGALIDFGNLLSTDAIMPSSPPKGTMLSFDYNASATMWAQWDVEHPVDLGDVKKEV